MGIDATIVKYNILQQYNDKKSEIQKNQNLILKWNIFWVQHYISISTDWILMKIEIGNVKLVFILEYQCKFEIYWKT